MSSNSESKPNQSVENHNANNAEDSDNDDSGSDWEEEPLAEEEPTPCLFCDKTSTSIEAAIEHLRAQHSLDLSEIKRHFDLDQFNYIKMINYIRTHKTDAAEVKSLDKSAWNDEIYMKPVVIDSWLLFDIEDFDASNQDTSIGNNKTESLENKLKEKDAVIEQLKFQISQMQKHFQDLIERTDTKSIQSSPDDENGDESTPQTHVAEIPIGQDQPYFSGYAHFDIHHQMLSDTIRTESYRDAILSNKPLFENKIVMDVGCGTSILSMFSSQAGAKQVIAVDQSDIIYQAMDITIRNNVKHIDFVKGRLEDVDLPLESGQRVDIIISEWMGYFLLFEGMLDSVIHAREKYLTPGGLILPNRCTISLVGLSDVERHDNHVKFWQNVYGFDMSTLQSDALKEASVEVCPSDSICTKSVVMSELDMNTVGYDYTSFVYDFELEITKAGQFTAFAGYFDTFFDLPNPIQFSTGPHAPSTHWRQVVFYLKDSITVEVGDKIRGQFHCDRGSSDARALRVKIRAFDQELHYTMN